MLVVPEKLRAEFRADAERVKLGRLTRTLRVKLRPCDGIAEATTLVADAKADALITCACDAAGVPVAPALARLRQRAAAIGAALRVSRSGRGFRPFDETNEAYKLGVNYIVYGLTH